MAKKKLTYAETLELIEQERREQQTKWAIWRLEFRDQVCDHAKEIDETEELDWYALSVGWGIAKGLTPAQAHELALVLRYTDNYFNAL